MVGLSRGVFERRRDVLGFKQREIAEDFLSAGARSEQVEDVFDPDAIRADRIAPRRRQDQR
jgi:hypothetical protein